MGTFDPTNPDSPGFADVTEHDTPAPIATPEEVARVHELKTWPEYFEAVAAGRKPFEIRENDRGFRCGDVLDLREWSPETKEYTGRRYSATVSYVTAFAQQPGYVVLGLERRALASSNAEIERLTRERDEAVRDLGRLVGFSDTWPVIDKLQRQNAILTDQVGRLREAVELLVAWQRAGTAYITGKTEGLSPELLWERKKAMYEAEERLAALDARAALSSTEPEAMEK